MGERDAFSGFGGVDFEATTCPEQDDDGPARNDAGHIAPCHCIECDPERYPGAVAVSGRAEGARAYVITAYSRDVDGIEERQSWDGDDGNPLPNGPHVSLSRCRVALGRAAVAA